MAKLPVKRKIQPEDFPDQKWLPNLLAPINQFFSDVFNALNKNLTWTDNIAGEILTVVVDGSFPLDVKWTNISRPSAAWIGYCRETSNNHTAFTNGLFLDWEMPSNNVFRINGIPGITPTNTNKYTVTIVTLIS